MVGPSGDAETLRGIISLKLYDNRPSAIPLMHEIEHAWGVFLANVPQPAAQPATQPATQPNCKSKQAPGGDSASSPFRVSGLFYVTTV